MDIKNILEASRRIDGVIHKFPLEESKTFSKMTGGKIYLKTENRQKTGAFKVRGAYNKMAKLIEDGEKVSSVVACSAGNHAQGVAYSAGMMGIPATIVMPNSTPIAKIEATKGYGAEVVLFGDSFDDTQEKVDEIIKNTGAYFIHPFNDEDVMAGQGTIGLEIMDELPDADIVVVPTGGGGLLAGMAVAIKSINKNTKVIGVQSENISPICDSFNEQKYCTVDCGSTIAEGIAVKCPGKNTVPIICEFADNIVKVSDDELAAAVLLLLERTKNLVEPSGAASVAAVLSGKIDVAGKKVVCLLSGGNVDVGMVSKIIEKGLIERGRRLNIRMIVDDSPGVLANIMAIISSTGANILNVHHDRNDVGLAMNKANLKISCEVSGPLHGELIIKKLADANYCFKNS